MPSGPESINFIGTKPLKSLSLFKAPGPDKKSCSMAIKIIDHGTPDYERMVALRYEILRKPLSLSFSPEDLEKEKNDILIGAFDEDRILACCILTRYDEERCKLRQMAVHRSQQGKGVGGQLLNFAENVARDKGYRRMMMHARKTAIGFYEKLGYSVRGDEFLEVTIPHFQMEKTLI
jgi:GNAT superfamily N-acetyltransferase